MQWDTSDQAGFTTGTPWLPIHDDYITENAETESKDPSSVLSWYRKLTSFRSEKAVLINGAYKELLPESEEIYAFERKNENDRIVILVNFTGEDVSYDPEKAGIDKAAGEKILHSSYEDIKDFAPASIGNLRPYEAVLIGR